MIPLPKYIFLGIALYLLYRFIFHFVIPIARTTRQVRRQFRDMHNAMNGQDGPFRQYQQQDPSHTQTEPQKPTNDKMGEYIDFEEIK